jgi:hypothetical protein
MTEKVGVYNTISLIGFILSGIMLIFTALLFFKFEIPKLIGDISGATARKAIKELKESNMKAVERNSAQIQLVRESSQQIPVYSQQGSNNETEKLSQQDGYSQQDQSQENYVQQDYSQQNYPQQSYGQYYAQQNHDFNETQKLSQQDYIPGETSVLQPLEAVTENTANYNFQILYEEILINTTEVI